MKPLVVRSVQAANTLECAVKLMSVWADRKFTEYTGAIETGVAFDKSIPGQGRGQYLAPELIALKVGNLKFRNYQMIFDDLLIDFEVWTKPSNYESMNNGINVRPHFFVTECQCWTGEYCCECGNQKNLRHAGCSISNNPTLEHTHAAEKYPL